MDEQSVERKIDEMHKFWFTPPVLGQPSRAEQIDALLTLTRNSRFTIRAVLWASSAILAAGTAYIKLSDYFKGG